mmetsp:Transcript_26264/g.63287  ORF Transcript_26264/g.63287 Transcript_26264/m.63287 type:complete len:209 (+) Transcript_26264:177-803(+)
MSDKEYISYRQSFPGFDGVIRLLANPPASKKVGIGVANGRTQVTSLPFSTSLTAKPSTSLTAASKFSQVHTTVGKISGEYSESAGKRSRKSCWVLLSAVPGLFLTHSWRTLLHRPFPLRQENKIKSTMTVSASMPATSCSSKVKRASCLIFCSVSMELRGQLTTAEFLAIDFVATILPSMLARKLMMPFFFRIFACFSHRSNALATLS